MADFQIKHDYSIFGTLECIDRFLRTRNLDCEGLRFQGEGWYRGNNDTLLLVPEGDRWRLYGWRNHDPRPVYQRFGES